MIGGLAVLIGSGVGVFLNPTGAIFGPLTIIPRLLRNTGNRVSEAEKRISRGRINPHLAGGFLRNALKAASRLKSTKSTKTTLSLGILNSVLFIYPIERIFLLVLTYVIATTYYSLRRAGLIN